MRPILTLLIIVISISGYTQDKRFSVKLSPLALIDGFSFPTIRGGFEISLSKKISLYNELGLKYRKTYIEKTDTGFLSSKGFKAKTEVRYYLNNIKCSAFGRRLEGYYLAVNIFYNQDVHNASLGYYYERATEYDSLTTILALLDTSTHKKLDIGSVQINFNSKGKLQLAYKDSFAYRSIILNGVFSKKGYYEIFFRNEKIEIPPVVHFIFSSHNIKRLRIYETKDNDLIIYDYDYVSGNFLLEGVKIQIKDESFSTGYNKHKLGQICSTEYNSFLINIF